MMSVAQEKGAGPVHVVEPFSGKGDAFNDFMADNERVAAATLKVLEENGRDTQER